MQFRNVAGNVSTTYTDSILLDRVAPTGSVVINGDAATTSNRLVSLTLSATDAAEMRFSWNGTSWSAWEPYATTRDIWMGVWPAGTKTIRAQLRDAAGNMATVTDSINYAP